MEAIMNNVCDLISMPVISLYESCYLGIVKNVLFDSKLKKAVYIVIYDDISDEEKTLPVNKIYSIKDAVMIKNCSDTNLAINLELELETLNSLINLKVYTCLGQDMGRIKDVALDKNYKIINILLNNGECIDNKNLLNIGKTAAIVADKNAKVNIEKFKVRVIPELTDTDIVVKAMDTINPKKVTLPSRQVANHRMLIDRKVSKNIIANNGEVIIKQNTKITSYVIELARSYGLLAQLTKYSI